MHTDGTKKNARSKKREKLNIARQKSKEKSVTKRLHVSGVCIATIVQKLKSTRNNAKEKITMALSNIERETIITFNAAEDTAEVYTADPVYIRKLDKLCEQFPDTYKFMAELSAKRCKESKTYSMPKRLVKFRPPVTREISKEQREALAERLRKAREAKNI
jgi:hypothetical protein